MSIDIEQRNIHPLFPSLLFSSVIEDKKFLNDIKYKVMKLTKDESAGDRAGNIGWYSNDNLHQNPDFKELAMLLLKEIASVMDYLHIVRDETYLTSMWANVSYRPEYCHQNHVHPNSLYSGVLHISCPQGSAGTAFNDPRPGARILEPSYSQMDIMNSGVFIPKCQEGSLFIFPSYLPHGVHYSLNSYGKGNNRITISFNAMILGEITTRTAPLSLR